MEAVTVNRQGRARRAFADGREWLVAPMSMLVPGVLAGSRGALYYPPEEVARTANHWNGTPITVGHPTRNGLPVSASEPGIHDSHAIGHVTRARFEKNSLRAEGWFDAERVRAKSPEIYHALISGRPMELSTGLGTSNRPVDNGACPRTGRPYTHIATNYRPDHLAVLPHETGACSLKDGCGLNVNSAANILRRADAEGFARTHDRDAAARLRAFSARVRNAGPRGLARLVAAKLGQLDHSGAMPGYGQTYVLGNRVWYVGGDGDDLNHYKTIKSTLESIPGVAEVIYEAESFPPETEGWVKVFNAAPVEEPKRDESGKFAPGGQSGATGAGSTEVEDEKAKKRRREILTATAAGGAEAGTRADEYSESVKKRDKRVQNKSLSGGHWVTTDGGARLYIRGGKVVAGNPHVIAAAKGKSGGAGRPGGGGTPAGPKTVVGTPVAAPTEKMSPVQRLKAFAKRMAGKGIRAAGRGALAAGKLAGRGAAAAGRASGRAALAAGKGGFKLALKGAHKVNDKAAAYHRKKEAHETDIGDLPMARIHRTFARMHEAAKKGHDRGTPGGQSPGKAAAPAPKGSTAPTPKSVPAAEPAVAPKPAANAPPAAKGAKTSGAKPPAAPPKAKPAAADKGKKDVGNDDERSDKHHLDKKVKEAAAEVDRIRAELAAKIASGPGKGGDDPGSEVARLKEKLKSVDDRLGARLKQIGAAGDARKAKIAARTAARIAKLHKLRDAARAAA